MVSVMGPGREIELGFLRVFARGLATEFVSGCSMDFEMASLMEKLLETGWAMYLVTGKASE